MKRSENIFTRWTTEEGMVDSMPTVYYIWVVIWIFLLISCECDFKLESKPTIAEGVITKIDIKRDQGFNICTYEYHLTLDTGSTFVLICGAWKNFGPVYVGQKIQIKELNNPGEWIVPFVIN